jgi:spore coat polysaccharide biosynthesis protein SpsF
MTKKIVAIVQARMGSTRLPGKMMFALGDQPVIQHVVTRAKASTSQQVIVATTDRDQDDILASYARRVGADVYRGSEKNVLSRIYEAAQMADADIVVRLTGDNTLVPPDVINAVSGRVANGADYATNNLERTFPLGMDAEAFSVESFENVVDCAQRPEDREHVTRYYRDNPEQFDTENVPSTEIFEDKDLQDRTDLRVTLDEPDDYELLRNVYEEIPYDEIVDAREAIRFIDDNELADINDHVVQRS